MDITFTCPCGKILSARARDAGKRGKCPHCGATWKIAGPAPAQSTSSQSRFKPREIEAWLFSHQRQLWWIAAAVVLAVVPAFLWYLYQSEPAPQANAEHRPTVTPIEARGAVADAEEEKFASDELALAISAGRVTPIRPDSPAWTTDFLAFAGAVRDMTLTEAQLQETFTNREIRWTVTFSSLHAESALYFEEAADLLVHRPPVQVWVSLSPSALSAATALRPGSRIVVHGIMGHPMQPRTAEFPAGVFQICPKHCVIELLSPAP